MKKLLWIVVGIVAVALIFLYVRKPETAPGPDDRATACSSNGGVWNETAEDCETTNTAWCGEAGGTYAECASACRTATSIEAPPETICTLQCVAVCRFN